MFDLNDIIIPNSYSNVTNYGNAYVKKHKLQGHIYQVRVQGTNANDTEIHKYGFGHLNRFSNYKSDKNDPKYNSGYANGFYITGKNLNYLITIGANTTEGYEYLRKYFQALKK